MPVRGHRDWAIATSTTLCPGDAGELAVDAISQFLASLEDPIEELPPMPIPIDVEKRIWEVADYVTAQALRKAAADLIAQAEKLEAGRG